MGASKTRSSLLSLLSSVRMVKAKEPLKESKTKPFSICQHEL